MKARIGRSGAAVNVPAISQTPAVADQITFAKGTVTIPD